MEELAEIAVSVAKALGLSKVHDRRFSDGKTDRSWSSEDWVVPMLNTDGSNLFAPYWQVRCRDWLLEHGYEIAFYEHQDCTVYEGSVEVFGYTCTASEFCARAIHALVKP